MKLRELISQLQQILMEHPWAVDVEVLMCDEHHEIRRVFFQTWEPWDRTVVIATEDED